MTGLLDRMMRASVSLASRIQPRKALRQADETLYSSPISRDTVQSVSGAGRRLLASGTAVNGLAVIGWRRSEHRIGVTTGGADLGRIGPDSLTSIRAGDSTFESTAHAQVAAAVEAGASAAVWAHPTALLTMAAAGRVPVGVVAGLSARVGRVALDGDGPADVVVYPGEGCLATGDDPIDAAIRLEAAERLAAIEGGVDR